MSETLTSIDASAPTLTVAIKKLIGDLDYTSSTIDSLLNNQKPVPDETIQFISSLLKQAQKTVLASESRNREYETKLEEARRIAKNPYDLQTLLDILPVGIIISHDPQNRNMTINRAAAKMLNLPLETNPSKSAPGGDQLPFKVLRAGKEIPPAELPIQYAVAHKIALHDLELEIEHTNGNVINVLEYASPLYDDQGTITGCLDVMVDISLRKAIERRLVLQYDIARILAESTTINKAAAQVLHKICVAAGWEYGALWRVETDSLTLTNEGVWHTENNTKLYEYAETIRYSSLNVDDTSLPGYVFRSARPLWLTNMEDFSLPGAFEAQKAGLLSAFILPVRAGAKIIAILEFFSSRNQIQDANLMAMINAVCSQIGIFLERKLLEEALALQAKQQHLLAEAGLALSSTLDFEARLQNIMHVIVPELADWCAIDIIDGKNNLRRIAAAHVDPNKEDLLYKIQPTRQVNPEDVNRPQVEILRTGQSLLYSDLDFSLIEESVSDPDQLEMIRQLNPRSSITVPLSARNQIMGICTLVYADSRRRYTTSDLVLAEDIARRAAFALDNALLFAESQELNTELERRVENRTTQLQSAISQLNNQINERRNAENQVRTLNAELEQRIAERTSQLETSNLDLHKEVMNHQRASEALRILLKRTRELYRISQTIGTVVTPKEVLSLLVSSSYLRDVSRSSIAILGKPWVENEPAPEHCTILAEWNKAARLPRFIGRQFTLEEYGLALPVPYGQPIVIQDIQSDPQLSEGVRRRFADLQTHSLIILPMIAGGEWYGLLSLHFNTRRMTSMDDLRHVRGLVDESAIVIKNMRLLEAESQARREAEKANDLKLKFLGMISHELRTPLTSIKGFATTLLAKDVVWSAEKQLDFLETIDKESNKLHDLIEQLLDLSRMEAGILRILPEKLSMNKIIDSALAQLQAITPDHDLVFNIPPKLPLIIGDEQRIAQVLTNLVNNAARYSPAHTEITLSAYRAGDMVQIDVSDKGPGIPPQDRVRVFEAFRQLETGTGSRTKGAGLGLAICKGLVEAQNGKIWIQDQRGPGTVVSFTLPLDSNKNDTK